MRRQDLEHIIRAASTVADDDELVIIGSQAILGQFPNAPAELCVSVEADVYPKNHPARWDLQLGFPALYLAGGVLGAIVIHDLIGLEARYPLWGRVAGGDPSRLRAVLAPGKAVGQASQAWGRHFAAAQRNRHPGSTG